MWATRHLINAVSLYNEGCDGSDRVQMGNRLGSSVDNSFSWFFNFIVLFNLFLNIVILVFCLDFY